MPNTINKKSRDSLFVWRHSKQIDGDENTGFMFSERTKNDQYCPYCRAKVDVKMSENGWERGEREGDRQLFHPFYNRVHQKEVLKSNLLSDAIVFFPTYCQ